MLKINKKLLCKFNCLKRSASSVHTDNSVLVTADDNKAWYFNKLITETWIKDDYLFDQSTINQAPPVVYTLDQYNAKKDQIWNGTKNGPIFDINKYFSKLKTGLHGRTIIYAPILTSTQGILNNRFAGINEGLVCVTGIQTSGMGRGNNVWKSPYGCLMFSYKSALDDPKYLPQIQYLASLAIIKTIHEFPKCKDLDIKIKWPNDIYAQRKLKICGILCQSTLSNGKYDITSGIGLNLSNPRPTTCILDLIKQKYPNDNIIIDREEFLAKYFNNYGSMFTEFKQFGFKKFKQSYIDNWLHTNQKVQIVDESNNTEVIVKSLSDDGYLLAVDNNGNKIELLPDGNRFDFFKGLISRKIN